MAGRETDTMKLEASAAQVRALLDLAPSAVEAQEPGNGERRDPARIPPPLLERYRSLLAAGRRPPVVAIVGGACSGCHVRLPTTLEYQALHVFALYSCPRCRRLLYAPDFLEAADDRLTGATPRPRAPGRPPR
jgi:predicted  nucleic acid-binding Zn-ribbon protein